MKRSRGVPSALLLVVIFVFLHSTTPTTGEIPPSEASYNILMLLPISSRSHRNVFMPLATALAARGHKVTMLSNHEAPDQNPKIKYIRHNLDHFKEEEMDMFAVQKNPSKIFDIFTTVFPLIARDIYDVPVVKELYNKRSEFDLFIVDAIFNEGSYPFVYGKNFIVLCPGLLDPSQSAVVGNLLNPAYVPNMLADYPRPYSFITRVKNIFFSLVLPITWRKSIVTPVEAVLKKRFPNLPPLLEIERNQSLTLINSHFSLGIPLPLLPSQVEIGGMHLRPAKPLPKDIAEVVSGKTPVIYMSLGSVARSSSMPEHFKKMILAAFARLPYKVIWKFEEEMENLPKNVIIKKWMPQQDILAHPNVKLFISHCGLLGSQEAMYHGTPILGLPIFGDQPKHAAYLQNVGVARYLEWEDLTEQLLVDTIQELVSNPSYRQKMSEYGAKFMDQPESPVDRAVFWTEYVIRHKGARHMRSAEWSLSWVELLHLDIALALHLMVYIIYKILRKICSLCCSSSAAKKSKSKRE
uniref:UDP-glucuronosyltransferase n=2 Tax=Hirondellea gigas TaxID=1518452 RepID=A0A2P2I7E1_9CRUS